MMRWIKYITFGWLLSLVGFSHGWSSTPVDHSLFDRLLKKNVKNGVVDYGAFKREESELDRYLAVLEGVKPEKLSRDERFAFYVNAYNAWTIKLVLGGYPGVQSIKELATWPKTPWKKKICRIDGKMLSLDDIEHRILRPLFKDPRVHFAINCAARSCPPLRGEAYLGERIHAQLDDSTGKFINDAASTYLDGKKLYVSRIFKWFSEDFNGDAKGFVEKYARGDLKTRLAANRRDIKVKYLDYDWSLNVK